MPTGTTLAFTAPDGMAHVPALRTLNPDTIPPTRASDPALTPGTAPSRAWTGSTLVLSSVTSFQVQVFTQQPGINPATLLPYPPGPDFVDVAGTLPGSFESSSAGYNILAVKVTVRIWDSSSQLSRQITIVQDM